MGKMWNIRQQVWSSAWYAVAQAESTKESKIATSWADKCLAAWDERFNPEKFHGKS